MFYRGGDWRDAWGYKFEWTPEHLTPEQLRPFMFSYDVLGSECLDRLDNISPQTPKDNLKMAATATRDLYALLKEHANTDAKLQQLWTEVNTVPDWVDWDQIDRGQQVFYRYGGPMVVALAFQSLLGGMGGRRVVETLARTGGFGVNVARRRLLETFQHILQVTRGLDSIRPGGEGFASSVRVRFLHASVRRRIMGLARERPDYYDVESYGVPVNDLDSISTVCTFCAAPIWSALPRQGIFLREREVADYVALWRWVAHLLGTPTEYFATPARAKVMAESLVVSEIDPTETSRVLANNILTGLADTPPAFASREFLCAEAHWLNGRQIATGLGIERPRLYHTALVAGQCLFFMVVSYVSRSVPSWDKRRINRARKLLYNAAVRNSNVGGLGGETNFDFQYIPQLGQTTEPDGGPRARGRPPHPSVETRNLKALLLASVAAGALAWMGARAISSLLEGMTLE
ncbi:Tat pathway signal sequence [Pleurostoma richardsiae]|uniref:Tat pathway signal sequence n=1 Tax=Pleurostoma richardsiae TaxID=41990 RepID=A0AA38RA19_9PEZI|nr:Tat pathway signal sequence [Pleurostoma richardsiae]